MGSYHLSRAVFQTKTIIVVFLRYRYVFAGVKTRIPPLSVLENNTRMKATIIHVYDMFFRKKEIGKARIKQFRFCPSFVSTNLSTECWVRLNRFATLSKALKKVESLSNGSRIKFELDQTFARLPYNSSLVTKKGWVL